MAFKLEGGIEDFGTCRRLPASGVCAFYVPDVAEISDAAVALGGIDLYIGDGATVTRPIIRRREGTLIGHAPIRSQLDWCNTHRARRAIFTHCGSQIVGSDGRSLGALVRRLGHERGVEARIAHDGLRLNLGNLAAVDPTEQRDCAPLRAH